MNQKLRFHSGNTYFELQYYQMKNPNREHTFNCWKTSKKAILESYNKTNPKFYVICKAGYYQNFNHTIYAPILILQFDIFSKDNVLGYICYQF